MNPLRFRATDSPRKIATIQRQLFLHMRVVSGAVLLSRDQQTLMDGGGLAVTQDDGIQSLQWDAGELWFQKAVDEGTIEVILP